MTQHFTGKLRRFDQNVTGKKLHLQFPNFNLDVKNFNVIINFLKKFKNLLRNFMKNIKNKKTFQKYFPTKFLAELQSTFMEYFWTWNYVNYLSEFLYKWTKHFWKVTKHCRKRLNTVEIRFWKNWWSNDLNFENEKC